jgi:hypothetical protein
LDSSSSKDETAQPAAKPEKENLFTETELSIPLLAGRHAAACSLLYIGEPAASLSLDN